MSTHTPEPWSLFTNRHPETNGKPWGCIESKSHPAGGAGVCPSGINTYWSGEIGRANAARIVACVNALAGVEDPAAAIREAMEAMKSLIEGWDFDEIGQFDGELVERLRAALAKLGGTA